MTSPVSSKIKELMRRLLLGVLFISAIISIGFWTYKNIRRFEEQTIDNANQYMLTLAMEKSLCVKRIVHDIEDHLELLSLDPFIDDFKDRAKRAKGHKHSTEGEDTLFDHTGGRVDAIYRVDTAGKVIKRLPHQEDSTGRDLSGRPGVKYVLKHQTAHISDIFTAHSGAQAFSINRPVFDNGEFLGIVRGIVTLEALNRILCHIESEKMGYVWVMDTAGVVINHPDPKLVGRKILEAKRRDFPGYEWAGFEDVVLRMKNLESGFGVYHSPPGGGRGPKGHREIISFVPVTFGNRTWSVAVTADYDEIVRPIQNNTASTVLSAFFFMSILGAGSFIYLGNRKKKVELELLAKSAESLRMSNVKLTDENERRKIAEEALRKSEEHFRSLIENALDAVAIIAADGTILYESPAAERIMGIKPEDMLGTNAVELVHPDHKERIAAVFARAAQDPELVVHEELPLRHGDGSWRVLDMAARRLQDEPGVVVNYRDITERKAAEEALRASEKSYRLLAENATDIIWTTDLKLKYTYMSPSVETVRGYTVEEAMEQSIEEVLTGAPIDMIREALSEELALEKTLERRDWSRSRTLELEMSCKDGSTILGDTKVTFLYDNSDQPIGLLGVTRDITEKKQLEQQLLHAQRMESIGTLAGGIAHDFNNLLGGILGYASLAKTKVSADDDLFKYLDTIEKSGRRAAGLTGQLLAFARRGRYEAKVVDMNDIVNETLEIISRTFDKSIEIKTSLQSSLPTLEADPTQIDQIIMNLCVNARDAMQGKGILTIETGAEKITDAYIARHIEAKPGSYVTVSISDTGAGMDKETLRRAFEPFFTTKDAGKGTGLGLSMVYGAAKAHGGFVRVESKPGQGSTFKVYIPANGQKKSQDPQVTTAPKNGSELILIVDDEKSMLSLARDILQDYGYKTLLAANGTDALEIYGERKDDISLVILDLIMPAMDGAETFVKLKEVDPEVRSLLSTGYIEDGRAEGMLDSGVLGFIQKPYNVDELLSKVRSVLEMERRP